MVRRHVNLRRPWIIKRVVSLSMPKIAVFFLPRGKIIWSVSSKLWRDWRRMGSSWGKMRKRAVSLGYIVSEKDDYWDAKLRVSLWLHFFLRAGRGEGSYFDETVLSMISFGRLLSRQKFDLSKIYEKCQKSRSPEKKMSDERMSFHQTSTGKIHSDFVRNENAGKRDNSEIR